MSIRKRKVMINKAGGTAGENSVNYRISLPAPWLKDMGIDEEIRDLIMMYHEGKITIIKEEEGMENIIVNISQYEGVKMIGTKLSSEIIDDRTDTRYDHISNGLYSPYEVKVEIIKEIWEVIKADGSKGKLEFEIINEYYKKNKSTDILCDNIKEMVLNNEDVEIYGEIVDL